MYKRVLFLFFFVLSSCSFWFDEDAKKYKERSYSFDLSEDSCLADFGDKIAAYFAQSISEEEFSRLWSCFAVKVKEFALIIEGEEKGSYTAKEILDYLGHLHNRSEEPSKLLQSQLVHVKKFLLGGGERFTKEEIIRLHDLLNKMKPSLVSLLKYMSVYTAGFYDEPDQEGDFSEEQLEFIQKASHALNNVVQSLATSFKPKASYSLVHFMSLAIEVDRFFYDEPGALIKFMNEWFSFVFHAQNVVLGHTQTFSPNEWKNLVSFISSLYATYYEYANIIRKKYFFTEKYLEFFLSWGTQIFDLFSNVASSREDQVITYKSLSPFFKTLHNKKVLPFDIDGSIMSLVVRRIFPDPYDRLRGVGLTPAVMEDMSSLFRRWGSAQLMVLRDTNQAHSANSWYLQQNLNFFGGITNGIINNGALGSAPYMEYYKRLKSLAQSRKYTFRAPWELWFRDSVGNDATALSSRYHLSMNNLILTVVERVFYSYSSSYRNMYREEDSQSDYFLYTLSEEEVGDVVNDFSYILKALGYELSTDTDSLSQLVFVLSNYFSSSATGSEVMRSKSQDCDYNYDIFSCETTEILLTESKGQVDIAELVDFVALSISALNKSLSDIAKYVDCTQGCYSPWFKNLTQSTTSNLARIAQYLSVNAQSVEFSSLIQQALFENDDELSLQEFFLTYLSLHFIESVVHRYDLSGDFMLDKTELEKSYEVFEGLTVRLLHTRGEIVSDESTRQAFHYVLTMPLDGGILDMIQFGLSPPPLQADVFSVAKVLATLLGAGSSEDLDE